MEVVTRISEIQFFIRKAKESGQTIGFVPTLGYFHKGHLSLMQRAREENDFVMVSIFVNPTQFGEGEDYLKYPRDLRQDKKLAEEMGVDLIFSPQVSEMYPAGFSTFINVENLTTHLCGISRPTHFRGVTTIVAKLFNIITPDCAYFGQKDYQQLVVIRQMVNDLNLNIKIVSLPIVREKDGLALSSRNSYLNSSERKSALILYKSLQKAKEMMKSGERKTKKIIGEMEKMIRKEKLAKIDYMSICNPQTLEDVEEVKGETLVALAIWIGKTRLIDNILLR